MSTTTTKYGLVKPALTDPADITELNGNWDKIDTELDKKLNKSGGTISEKLDFQRVNNGTSSIFKNHNASADYGLSLIDKGANNRTAELSVIGKNGQLMFTIDNVAHKVYHAANKPTPEEIGAMPLTVTNAVVG